MKIHFIGTSHGITEKDRNTSSIAIVTEGKAYLFDAGAPIMKLLQEHDIPFSSLSDVFITHSHRDHYIGLVEFTGQVELFSQFSGVKVKIHAPKNFPYNEMRRFLFGENDEALTSSSSGGSRNASKDSDGQRVTCEKYEAGEIFNDGTLKVTAIKTKHVEDSHAFLIEAEGKKVLITGDMRHDLIDFPEIAYTEDLDVMISEAAHFAYNNEAVINKFKDVKTKKLLITHIYYVMNPSENIEYAASKFKGFETRAMNDGDIVEI